MKFSEESNIRLVAHRTIPEDESLRAQWNALVWNMERPEVFYTYEWALAVDRAYRSCFTPLLFLGYDRESLIGVASLASSPQRRETSFLAATTADYCDFICAPAYRSEFLNAVFDSLHDLQLPKLVLANLPADSHTVAALTGTARRHGYALFSRPAYDCAQIQFNGPEERRAVERTLVRKHVVRDIERLGGVQVEHLKTWPQIERALPEFARAHVARFLSTGRISNLVRPERQDFLVQLAQLLSQSGWLALSRLLLHGQAIAWNYGFQFAGSWFWYQPTFDSEFQQYSPGLCLLTKMVEQACDDTQITMVDLGLGAEPYKDRLANRVRQTLYVTAATSAVSVATAAIRYRAVTALTAKPSLEAAVRQFSGQLSRTREKMVNEGIAVCASRGVRRLQGVASGSDEVLFFEYAAVSHPYSSVTTSLRAIDLRLLAAAAMEYSDDRETLDYMLRCAARLRSATKGFALMDAKGIPVHFCWVADFEAFAMAELGCKLRVPSGDSALLFDCRTPKAVRGRGLYGVAIARVGSYVQGTGRSAWIFSAAMNRASFAGIRRAGFVHRFSLIRNRSLFSRHIVRVDAPAVPEQAVDAACAD